MERTFFHDVNNMLCGLIGASELLCLENSQSELAKMIYQSSLRLKKEVEIQRCLSQSETYTYNPSRNKITTGQIQKELRSFFINHPAARNKNLQFPLSNLTLSVNTDISLLLRVLCNMVTNALEVTEENGTVKVWQEQNGNFLVISEGHNLNIHEAKYI